MGEALTFLLDNIYVRFGTKLFRQIVGIPMGTNCALLDNIYIRFGTKLFRQTVRIPMGTNCTPVVAGLSFFCYERDFVMSLSEEKQYEATEAFSSTSRYLDDLLTIDNNYFDGLISQICPSELQLNKVNSSEFEAPCLDLYLSILDGFISCKIMINAMILILIL